jgi:hypothetical protein
VIRATLLTAEDGVATHQPGVSSQRAGRGLFAHAQKKRTGNIPLSQQALQA